MKIKRLLALGLAVCIAACAPVDAARFDAVRTGQSRAEVVAILGEPGSASTREMLGVSQETLMYQGLGKRYTVTLVLGHVVAKSSD